MRASHDSRETFARVSHDVRANFDQFYLSQLSLEMVLFMSHICRIVQIAETSLRCVCEGLRRVGDVFATYAMTWRRFCDNITCLKLCRPVRDEFAMHARTLQYHANVSGQFRDSSQRFGDSIRKPIANSSHHSEIGALHTKN